jgi:hypothetical protein
VCVTDFGGCFPHTRQPTLKVGWNDTRRGIGHGDMRKFTHKIILVGQWKERYTLAVKLSDITVWRHTWRKNWVNCAVLTCNSAGLRTVLSSRLSRRELRSSLRESHSFLILPADTTMASSQGTQPSKMNKIHSTDEHRMIYSFSNTTSYFTFYAFFSSFRITLGPMWLANSKRRPCFYPP